MDIYIKMVCGLRKEKTKKRIKILRINKKKHEASRWLKRTDVEL